MDWRGVVGSYLREHLRHADAVEIVRVFHMGAGASNDTIGLDVRVASGGVEHTLPLVLRPERKAGILAPYDVARQFRVMRALAATAVPVPGVAWHEPDPGILGAPFFLMYRVEGETLPVFWYGARSPRLYAIAAALATVHAVDWQSAGLGFLLPPAGASGKDPGTKTQLSLPTPLAADMEAWAARARQHGLDTSPPVVSLARFLERNEPADARLAFLHGDPNPGNYLLRGDQVAAVLDWELAAIGDPRSDLGFYAALMGVFGGEAGPGSRTPLADAYESVTGSPLRDLEYYEGLGLYKMAIVMSGWGGISGFGFGLDAIMRRLSQLFGPRWAA